MDWEKGINKEAVKTAAKLKVDNRIRKMKKKSNDNTQGSQTV